MPYYFVNRRQQTSHGFDHEVHTTDCSWGKMVKKLADLGWHSSCVGAVAEARKKGYNADGCVHCCEPCHNK